MSSRGVDARVRGGAPHLGEHNDEVLREWLDYDTAAIAKWQEVLVQKLPGAD